MFIGSTRSTNLTRHCWFTFLASPASASTVVSTATATSGASRGGQSVELDCENTPSLLSQYGSTKPSETLAMSGMQEVQSDDSGILWSLWETLGQERQRPQADRRKTFRSIRAMAFIAIASWTQAFASQRCAFSFPTNAPFKPHVSASAATDWTIRRLDSAAILPDIRFANCNRNFFSGFSAVANPEPDCSRRSSVHASATATGFDFQCRRCGETVAGSLCAKSICHASLNRASSQRATHDQEYAVQVAHGSKPLGQGGEEDHCPAAHHSAKPDQLAELCAPSQTADPERSPSMFAGNPQCRTGSIPSTTRPEATTTVDFSDRSADVFHSSCSASTRRECHADGGRRPVSTAAMDCPSHQFQRRFSSSDSGSFWTLQSARHPHACRSFSIPTATGPTWTAAQLPRRRTGFRDCRWIFWPSHGISSPFSVWIFEFCTTRALKHVWSLAPQLLCGGTTSPTRTSAHRAAPIGDTSRRLEDTGTSSSRSRCAAHFNCHSNACCSGTQHHRAVSTDDCQSTYSCRNSSFFGRDLTDDAASSPTLCCSHQRDGATTSSIRLRASQCYAHSRGAKTGPRAADPINCNIRQFGAFQDDRSYPSRQKHSSRVPILLHSLAACTVATSSTASQPSSRRLCCNTSPSRGVASCASYSDWSRAPECRCFVITGVTSIGRSFKACQTKRRQCQGPTCHCGDDHFVAPSRCLDFTRIDSLRPSLTMPVKATDKQHGFQPPASHVVDFSMDFENGLSVGELTNPVKLRLDSLLAPSSPVDRQFWTLRESIASLRVPWPSDFLFQDLSLAMELFPDIPAELRSFFADCRQWQGETVSQMHLYTDGSASPVAPASWALVIIYECWNDSLHKPEFLFRGFAGALLHSFDSWIQHGLNVGEISQDALSSELVAIIWALGWTLQDTTCSVAHFHYDNLAAGHGTFGLWNPPKGDNFEHLIKSATCLRQLLACQVECHGHHVKAHQGAPWNELADSVAKALSKGVISPVALPAVLPKLLHHALLEHAWTEASSGTSRDIRSCTSRPSVFQREGPPNTLSVDPFWKPPIETDLAPSPGKELTLALRIATANALTLDAAPQTAQRAGKMSLGRIGFLKTQFSPLQLHLIGLQESRSAGNVTRHSHDWWVFQSGCTDQGTHGVEIWASRVNPYGQDGNKPLYFQSHHFTVLSFHARFLLLEISAPALQVHVVCLHSPFAKSAAMDPQQFWTLLDSALDKRRHQNWPLIVMGDFNARLGSIQTQAVSSFQAEQESEVGTLMHQFMLHRNLCAPATFAHCHTTEGPTWKVDTTAAARIDYVLVPVEWLPCVISSAVHAEVDLLTEDDHQLAPLFLQLRLRNALKPAAKPPKPCLKQLSNPLVVQEFLHEVSCLQEVPWTFGVGVHCEWLTSKLQELSSRFFKSTSPQPLQQHLSPETWNMVTIRHTLLRTTRRLDSLLVRLSKLLHIHAWSQQFRLKNPSFGLSSSVDLQVLLDLRRSVFILKMDLISLRKKLQQPARRAIKQDRLAELKSIAVRFVNSASLSNPAQVHRSIKPLLGSHSRKAVHLAKPLPAIRTPEGDLAQSKEALASVWQHHFAAIEGGTPTASSQLQTSLLIASHTALTSCDPPPLDLQALPTLTQIEAVIRRSKNAKAPGPDNFIFKLDPVLFARLLYPLYLKIGIRCSEPLKFRGGEIFALAKKASSQYKCSGFRAIVLADQMGKYFHTMQRQKLLSSFSDFKAPMQAGCLAGIGVDHVHLQLEALASWASSSHRSLCVLFLDVASAYYKAVRPFIIDGDCSDESIGRMFLQNQWSPDLLHEFLANLSEPSAFSQAKVSAHKHLQTKLSLQATWFSLRNLPGTLTQTTQGTRPGNPLADLLFAFLFSRVSKQIQAQMDLAGCLDRFSVSWLPGIPLSEDERFDCAPGIGSWADGLYLACTTAAAKDLLPRAETISRVAIDAAASFGLFLNLGEDKTNLLLVPRGTGSFDFKRSLAAESKPCLPVRTQSLGLIHVQIVKDYIHLGTLFDGISCRPETQHRYLVSSPLVRQLRRPVFGALSLSTSLRSMLLQSYVLSRFLFGVSTWHFATKRDYQLWFSKLIQIYSVLLPRHTKGPGFQSLDLLAATQQLHPALLLAKHRLALLSRMFDTSLAPLWSILQASQVGTPSTGRSPHCGPLGS